MIYITSLASNEIFSPSNKIHWEVGRAKDLSAPLYTVRFLTKMGKITYNTKLRAQSVSREVPKKYM